jgi:hypothetical protein
MKIDKKIAPAVIAVLLAATAYVQSFGATLITLGLAAVFYGLTNSTDAVIFILAVPFALKGFNAVMSAPKPLRVTGVEEGFQAKDPQSIQARIEQVRAPAPLQPKVASPTGVLESANILDNTPLQPLSSLASEALPGASIPASAKARVLIYPPEEQTVPATGIREYLPFANPVLQNGPDNEAVETTMARNGAEMPPAGSPAMNTAGVAGGAGPAF